MGRSNVADKLLTLVASALAGGDFYVGLVHIAESWIARQQARYVLIEPGPITLRLTERQSKEWRKNTWDQALTDNAALASFAGDLNINVLAANQLKYLNTVDVSQKVVEPIC